METLITLLGLFPSDPFQSFIDGLETIDTYMGYVNYFIPIYSWVSLADAWLIAYLVYWVMSKFGNWSD